MAIEESKKGGAGAGDYDSKPVPRIAAASDSGSTSSNEVGRRGQVKVIDSTFDTTEDPRYYKPIPDYEGIHRWDPDFEWTEDEEKKVVRKVCSRLLLSTLLEIGFTNSRS